MIILTTLISIVCGSAQATEFMRSYRGIRALGMGGAYTAVVNDETALVNNPAALGKLRNSFTTLIDPEFELSTDAAAIGAAGQTGALTDIGAMAEAATTGNSSLYSRYTLFPSFVTQNFGFGILINNVKSARKVADNETDVYAYNDMTALLGYNLRLWGGRIKLGFNLKAMNRREVAGTYDLDTETVTDEALGREGLGVGSDVGLILTAPWTLLPTLSIVAKDVGTTTFSQPGMTSSTAEKPTPLPQSIDAGFALFPIINQNIRYSLTVDMHDVTNAYDLDDPAKKTHLGVEFNISDIFFLRAGYNQRSPTAGFEFATSNSQIQYAYYGEEVGTVDVPATSIRHVFKFAFRF